MSSSQPPSNSSRPAALRTALLLLILLPAVLVGADLLSTARSARAGGADVAASGGTTETASPGGAKVAEAYGKLPLGFEANVGQTDGRVRFIGRGVGYQLFLTTNEAVLVLREKAAGAEGVKGKKNVTGDAPANVNYRVLRMRLAGANEGAEAAGLDELPGKYNYFVGDDPARWRTDVPVYAKAEFRGVYRGIDLVYYGNQRQLEYDFVVAPGADPRAIKLQFEGAERVEVGGEGDLVLSIAGGEVRMRRPVIYQLSEDGARREVEGRYVVRGKQAAFEVGAYDSGRPLVIDPVLSYSTYLGAGGVEIGWGIAVDADGSAYVTGDTNSSAFPTTGQNIIPADNSTGHAFVTKLNPSGTALVYSTLVGGSSSDTGLGIALDASGSAYITGRTTSLNFPTVNAVRSNSNLIKSTNAGGAWAASNAGLGSRNVTAVVFDPSNASVVYASTDSGSGVYKSTDGGATWSPLNTGFQSAAALAIATQTPSTLYAATNQAFNGAVFKSTDAGASWAAASNGLTGGILSALAVDPSTPTTVYATASSGVFKTTDGGANWVRASNGINFNVSSIVVAPSNPAVVYAAGFGVFKTTNGGANWVQMSAGLTTMTVRSLAVDAGNAAVVYAATSGGGVFKTTNGAASWSPVNTGLTNLNVNVLAADPNAGSTLYAGTTRSGIFKTTDGGGNWAQVRAGLTSPSVNVLAVSPSSSVVLAGVVSSFGSSNNDREAFVTKLNPAGNALVYSTFLGGGGDDDGNAIAVNSAGQAHVAGTTSSADFQLANPRQATRRGLIDAFVTKLDAAGSAIVYSTYLGGSSHDNGRGVAVDAAGNAYVTGDTLSTDFTTTPGAFQTGLADPNPNNGDGDAFVVKLDPTGSSFVYATFLGASNGAETGFAVAADSDGNAYVAGGTESSNFPLVNPAQPSFGGGGSFFGDAFVTKLNASGSALLYSTFLGGTSGEHVRGIAVAPGGAAIVAGMTESSDFPATADSLSFRNGLFRTTDGGANWDNRHTGLVGGIEDVVFDPQVPATVYAVTSPVLFKSTNGGRTWSRTGLSVGCCLEEVAVDPQNSSVLYAVGGLSAGPHVFKSTDGGASWAPSNGGLSFFDSKTIVVDPQNSSILYLGSGSGVAKSTNGGASWVLVNEGINVNFPRDVRMIAIDPVNTSTLYATVGSSAALFKTTNGGGNWTRIDTNFPINAQTLRVTVVPSNSSTIYAATTSGVLKSTDAGATWVVSLTASFANEVVIDPQNHSILYASLSGAQGIGSVFVVKSVDGGATWQPTGGLSTATHGLAINTASTVIAWTGGLGGTDAFVAKLDPTGASFVYATYLSGKREAVSSGEGDFAFAVAADAQGNAYVTGGTRTIDFPTTPGAFQTTHRGGEEAFVAKLEDSFTVSGTVTSGGTPQPGVRVTLSGDELRAVTTGADGGYSFNNLRRGASYTVSASKVGFTFAPASHTFNNLSASHTADFAANVSSTPFHTISGRVAEPDGAGVPGVLVRLTGSQIEFTNTGAAGNYSFTAPAGGNYTLTPSALGFTFSPPTQTVNNLGANQTADFTAARQTLVVTNTNDTGAGSLRQAIIDANAIPGRDTIHFNIPGAGVKTITPDAVLPDLSGPVVIDASTQPGYNGSPLVELDGTRSTGNGLRLAGGNSVVRGLSVFRFGNGSGLLLVGNGNVVEGCYVGIRATGATATPINNRGITVTGSNNRIGGTTPAARNVISGNSFEGVSVSGAANLIKGNFIGTNPAGNVAIPNGVRGIDIGGSTDPAQTAGNVIGGTEPGAGNVVSGNGNGNIGTSASGTIIQGNFIGTDATGTAALGGSPGINLQGRNTLIGGTSPAARNVISGNGGGISVSTFSTDPQNVIHGNFIGVDVTGARALPNNTGIEVNSSNAVTTIGGTAPGQGNVISGNTIGIHNRLGRIAVLGNLIGTDASGNAPLGNEIGVVISDANNRIGGAEPGARNVISGNLTAIQLGGLTTGSTDGSVIRGNFIGTNADGTAPLPNTVGAVTLSSSNNNTIGGDEAGQGNLIAFNGAGIRIDPLSLNNFVRGNRIFSNGALGLDLDADTFVAPNDALDADAGANKLQNFPVITSVTSSGGATIVRGALSSTPNTAFRIDLYSNLSCDPSGNGEGGAFFGSADVTTNANGDATIDINVAAALPAGRVVTATATDPAGNTSEFSSCAGGPAAGSIEFTAATFSVLEDVGSAIITLRRAGGSGGALTVAYATGGGTATPGTDYTPASGSLVFADGETTKSFLVPIADDGTAEPQETVNLTLSTTELESLGPKARAVLRILDSNTPLTVSGEPLDVAEGNAGRRNAVARVSLNAATSRTVTVDFAAAPTGNGATGGVDFIPVSGTLTFAPGVATREVLVPIVGDTLDEPNENFLIVLSNASGAALGNNGSVRILDDDPTPAATVSDLTVVEAPSAKAVFAVRLSAPSTRSIFVNYSTANGTATAGSDYTATSGSLTFGPGETIKFVEVSLLADAAGEPDQTFFLNLGFANNATVLDPQGVANITESASASVIQFASSANAAGESEGFIDISVTRSGDTSNAASVNFETVSQTASDKTDFTAALGTLRFAPGESSKTFRVLVTDDRFVEPIERLDLLLTNAVGATLGGPAASVLSITSDDATDGLSPVKGESFDPEFFVRMHYRDFLNREPDQAGLDFWVGNITSCGADAQCTQVKRVNVSAAFFLSIEFQETGFLAYRMYKAAYGDLPGKPAPVRLREFLLDSQEIGRGVEVGVGNWQQQLEANKNAYADAFVARQRFTSTHPAALAPEQFVDVLNANANGALSQEERDALVNALANGTMTRAQVLRRVAEDETLRQAETNRAFVLMQYFGYLRRDPDAAPDTDFAGYNFWLAKLEQFNGNFVNAEMVRAFIESIEYGDRFGR